MLCWIKKLKQRRKRNNDNINVDNFLRNHEFLAPKKYSYSQVKKMTNSFKVKLGQGGFGSVYRGELSNGNLVAVKVLNELKGNGEDFINEVASVGRTSHVNIVTLVGFCCDGHQRALIYEFMPNGSLEKFIYGRESSGNIQLGWEKLHQIAVGIAQGLEYLHKGCNTRILHFDIKPHNILLDQDLCPKISDFGLAKLLHEKRSMISVSRTRGTPGYIAPELFSRNFGQVSHKSDVYSYGMMILEIVGGRKNIEVEVDHTSEIYFPHWIYKKLELNEEQLGLHGIVSDVENMMVRKMIIVGLWCIQTNPLDRPTMTKVLEMLEGDVASMEIPPKPFLSSPTRSIDPPSINNLDHNYSFTANSSSLLLLLINLILYPSAMKENIRHHTSIIFLFVIKVCFCLDPQYESCVPKDCGDGMMINYPFYINGMQDPNCGYPGFQLSCNNSSPILQISNNSYSVTEIDYKNQSMRLSLEQEDITCLSNVIKNKNLTFDPTQFTLIAASKVIVLTNCSKPLPEDLTTRYRINGSCKPSFNQQLVMLDNDVNLRNLTEFCSLVSVPVELRNGGEVVDGRNYTKVLQRGFTVGWIASDCSWCEASGGRCGFNTTTFQFQCFCYDRPHRVRCLPPTGTTRTSKKHMAVIIAVIVGGVIILAVMILCLIKKLKQRRKRKSNVNVDKFLKNHEFFAPKRYSYSQVKKMTNSFKVKLGQGGFGSVYKGELSNGNLVAVKVLNELKGNGEDFINEVQSVGMTSHVNIVSLVGFCCDGKQRALIYEFLANGSLEKFIYGQECPGNIQLGWEKIHQIAIGIAQGLEYLHKGCNTRILHFDIKPHNILLDQDFCPKISDFGLAKLFHEKRSMISVSHIRGTPGYIAPELFFRNYGQVSQKSDVYSYGMMVLEMVGGRNNIEVDVDHTSEIYFPDWLYKKIEVDEEQLGLHGIVSDKENEMARKMIIVGLWCIQTNPLNRPTITKVLEMLEGDLASLEIPPKPYLSSPPRSIDLPLSDKPNLNCSITGSSSL
uniref:LEAF RUST 10 DISEASE-RESISTANCE LOCUS RECEPTOR-LIKE PROTEIN KINASE-like 2.1 n=1 Tax=Erigeron canadensis TaxID=72917 RepID=UPI001CB94635|nr:LEAF RUST 10 DISEASE-RESISTANCE LOCUS RECEPTOR-LIKE PROTEIN KINASE-like 2.1 [Erigeron canadensis]